MKNMKNYIKDYMQATYKIHFFLYCSYDYSLNFLKGNQNHHVRSHCDWADSLDSPGAHYHLQLWNGWLADTSHAYCHILSSLWQKSSLS